MKLNETTCLFYRMCTNLDAGCIIQLISLDCLSLGVALCKLLRKSLHCFRLHEVMECQSEVTKGDTFVRIKDLLSLSVQ